MLCGSLAAGAKAKKGTIALDLSGKDANVHLKISDISSKMVANIPSVLVDLLEIATYVYFVPIKRRREAEATPVTTAPSGDASSSFTYPCAHARSVVLERCSHCAA